MMNRTLFALCVGVLLLCLGGCAGREPILIGYSAELSGPRGELGVEGRDGALLAVEQINEAGGIKGTPLELVVMDDQGSPDVAREIDQELVEMGVVAVIGHITSSQTASVFKQMNQVGVILFSPASSSTEFSGQDDFFFRNVVGVEVIGDGMARYILSDHRDIKRLAFIFDLRNSVFSVPFVEGVKSKFLEEEDNSSLEFSFTSGETDLRNLMEQVKDSFPDGIVFVSSAFDTALMSQYASILELDAMLFSSSWAQTNELLEKGGKAVDGLELISTYDPHNPFVGFIEFSDAFRERYKREPALVSTTSYEAVLILAYALGKTEGKPEGLADIISSITDFPGAQGYLTFDQYGDVERDIYIVRIIDGRYEVVQTISPAQKQR